MMIAGRVLRDLAATGPLGTPGKLTLPNLFECDTLELQPNNNERGTSCIRPMPGGEPESYHGRVWWSPTLKRLVVRYEDKNGRKDCLIHNGNWAGEGEGQITQVHGCTEVGIGYGDIERSDKVTQWGTKMSGSTLAGLIEALRAKVNGQPVEKDMALDPDGFARGYNEVLITYDWKSA